PDDEAYGCAGALARAGADPDAAAVLLTLTRGEASSVGSERGLSPKEIGDLRAGRLEEVARITGLDHLIVESFPDGRLARSSVVEVSGRIREVVRALRPQVVIGHDPRGVNGHADHIAAHWCLRDALRGEAGVRFAMITYPPEVAEAAKPRLLFATPPEEMDAILDLSEAEIEAKEACLRVHEAIVTLLPDGAAPLVTRPPREHYDFLGEDLAEPLDDLFGGIEGHAPLS
ncbi:MAG: PIG-L deacetylase family protein, partial [Planctomycetota bacterium]